MASTAQRVGPTEAAELLKSGYKYLDVRTPEEFAAGHAPHAINIPFMLRKPEGMTPNSDFLSQVQEQFPDSHQKLVVGCKSGNRSARACLALQQEYQYLADNTGGWDAWVAANLPKTS